MYCTSFCKCPQVLIIRQFQVFTYIRHAMSTYINHIKHFFVLGEKSKKQHGMPLRKLILTQNPKAHVHRQPACVATGGWSQWSLKILSCVRYLLEKGYSDSCSAIKKKVEDKAEAKAVYNFWWRTFFNADNNAEPVIIDLDALDIAPELPQPTWSLVNWLIGDIINQW